MEMPAHTSKTRARSKSPTGLKKNVEGFEAKLHLEVGTYGSPWPRSRCKHSWDYHSSRMWGPV